MTRSHPHEQHRAAPRRRRAFTLIELLISITLIVILVGFLATALGRTTRSARRTASQRSAQSLAEAVIQFREQFGFLPPLVHDGELVSNGMNQFQIDSPDAGYIDGPVREVVGANYDYATIVAWNRGSGPDAFNFLRRRSGNASDAVELPSGGAWDLDSAWDDRRYSRYALAYYLAGALPRNVDGVQGEGFVRPQPDGSFVGIGYPVGSTRDRYQSLVDTDRSGISLRYGYARAFDILEHGVAMYDPDSPPSVEDIYNLYGGPDQSDALIALVDNFGTAYRYYRWEQGRYNAANRLVVETTLDMNIPPILLDPEALIELENEDRALNDELIDLTASDIALREAGFAIVGAGPDKLFGTEPIELLVDRLGERDPNGDPAEVARIRKRAMDDNVVALGK